ncbi:MAG TPA: biotin/lipoyl-binding protein, partial [Roseiflexaceae bacterium]|nr:biotin/lipoyl-binding protein [Roseiflexaceae bacterium]
MATPAPRKRRSRRRWWIIGSIVAVVLIGALVASQTLFRAPAQTGVTPGWTATKATQGAIEASVSASGTVAAQAQAEVRFQADGLITDVYVKAGDSVTEGQPLAQLDASDAQLQLESARADLEQARATLRDLDDGPTESELKDAQAKVAQAKAQYDQTLAQVSNADVS